MLTFAGDGSLGVYLVHFDLENTCLRAMTWQSVSWRVGWMRWNVWDLGYRWALQNFNASIFEHKQVVEPSHTGQMHIPVSQMKVGVIKDRDEGRPFFIGPHSIFGTAPIAAFANVAGRNPIKLKVSAELAQFLRTGAHADTKGGAH